jgi:ribosome maturation factor RimP
VITKEKILSLVDEVLTESQFIVELNIDAANKIYIEVDDKSAPISITDCIKVSRGVEHNLDREIEDFSLEVTSPGLDRPFKVFEQYLKNIGRPVKVKDTEGRIHKGTLVEASEEGIAIEYKEKRRIEGRKAKEWITEKIIIPMSDIKETYIEIVF